MSNRNGFWKVDEGQSIIVVTLALVLLIAFAALAIDMGHVYSERRRMQNSADFGALAGARELCLAKGEDAARAKAVEYMTLNGATTRNVTIASNIVDTDAGETTNTFLAGVIGWPTIDVGATAQAACGRATSGCGLWPIGFDTTLWQELYSPDSEKCKEQRFAVWSDSNDNQVPSCEVNGVEYTNICHCYDCDENNDGEDDFAVVTGEGRAWLDLSEAVLPYTDPCTASGCGAAELACQLRKDSGARIDLPKCISGDNGVKAGVKDDVNERIGDSVSIALYDSMGCSTSNCPGGDTYRVTSFGCIDVVTWDQSFQVDPIDPTSGYKRLKGKVIWAKVNCRNSCTTFCGSTDGTPPNPWEVTAVSLTR
jgi:hypothetical protein